MQFADMELWSNATNSYKVFILQKRVIRIMSGAEPRASYRSLFRKLEILPVPCQYMSSMLFIIDNPNNFHTVSEVHGLDTRSKNQLFIANTNLTSVQKCYKAAVLGEDDKKDAVLHFQWIHVVGIVWSRAP
jgi:hypothetical protein